MASQITNGTLAIVAGLLFLDVGRGHAMDTRIPAQEDVVVSRTKQRAGECPSSNPSGRIWNCRFPVASFRPSHYSGHAIVNALFRPVTSPVLERTALMQYTRILALAGELDDPEDTLHDSFDNAYMNISKDPGFDDVVSAMPYCGAGVGADQGNGFVYIPYNRPNRTAVPSALPAIVFLHGYGGNFLWCIWALKTEFPDHVILAPSGGMAWPDLAVGETQRYIEDMCSHVTNRFGIQIQRPWLMALSQGGPTGFRLCTSYPERYRGFVALATWADNPADLQVSPSFPILMLNGVKDRDVSSEGARMVFNELKGQGANITLKMLDGADHYFFLSQRPTMGEYIRKFIKQNDKVASPPSKAIRMSDCAGRYRWRTSDRAIDFTLNSDGTFTATQTPDTREFGEGWGLVNEGTGRWSVRNNRLSVTMDQVWCMATWVNHRVVWIDHERITRVANSGIQLERSNPLRTQ